MILVSVRIQIYFPRLLDECSIIWNVALKVTAQGQMLVQSNSRPNGKDLCITCILELSMLLFCPISRNNCSMTAVSHFESY